MIKNVTFAAIVTMLLQSAMLSAQHIEVSLGDGTIDGASLKPYSLTWQQCSWQDGEQSPAIAMREELTLLDEKTFNLRQTSLMGEGIESQTDLIFDRQSLAPEKFDITVTQSGVTLQRQEFRFDKTGYSGSKTQGEESTTLAGAANSTMLHGMAMGLPLAAMGVRDRPVRFKASMVTFDATYAVVATWVGVEMLAHDGGQIESHLVDVEWRHIESGDVYPPGPDGSGGRFWIVPTPPDGFPYVPRYKTDTYAIEFVPEYCE